MGEPDAMDVVPEQATNTYVVWDHEYHFQTRELTGNDLTNLGADPEDKRLPDNRRNVALEWTPANSWQVPRAEIPLNDIQLGGLLALEKSFRLVER